MKIYRRKLGSLGAKHTSWIVCKAFLDGRLDLFRWDNHNCLLQHKIINRPDRFVIECVDISDDEVQVVDKAVEILKRAFWGCSNYLPIFELWEESKKVLDKE